MKIWIDLDNTPHVPFFKPIIRELERRGFRVVLTARDAFQVCDLADKKGLRYLKIGRHHGKNRLMKGVGLVYRACQLAPAIIRERPRLGVSHGSRSQLLLSNWIRTPTLLIEDYEYSQFTPMMRPTWVMAPTVIPDSALCCKNGNIRKYPGIKEDVYVPRFQPIPGIREQLGVGENELMITIRPPASDAHYHNPESDELFRLRRGKHNHRDALQYLKKKELGLENITKGWSVVSYYGINIGWVKVLQNRINNYYPVEWRILKD